jgi:3-dehydroquinate synthase class II
MCCSLSHPTLVCCNTSCLLRALLAGCVRLCGCPVLQMLVEAETADGMRHSTLLQNAETVRLIGPVSSSSSSSTSTSSSSSSRSSSASPAAPGSSSTADGCSAGPQQSWQAVSVSELQPGQKVYLLLQEAARHTGISIQERICEK